jgi:site-specific DNA recombinase
MTQRTTALIYVRVSRLDRGDRERLREDGADAHLRALSPRTQIEQVKALPTLRGLKVEVFEDLHRSGKNTARPGLERLRERMEQPDVAAVAVWSMSRLGRSVPDLYMLLEEMHELGVAFVSAKESSDTATASGRAFVGFLAVLAQFERELTSERLVANLEQLARDGGAIGPLPFGYRRVDGEVVIDEPAARVVRTIFREYATGKYSYRDLASWLNENGHRPPNFDGRHRNGRPHATVFVADALTDILANTRYAGRVVYRPRRNVDDRGVAARFAAIIDEETWAA